MRIKGLLYARVAAGISKSERMSGETSEGYLRSSAVRSVVNALASSHRPRYGESGAVRILWGSQGLVVSCGTSRFSDPVAPIKFAAVIVNEPIPPTRLRIQSVSIVVVRSIDDDKNIRHAAENAQTASHLERAFAFENMESQGMCSERNISEAKQASYSNENQQDYDCKSHNRNIAAPLCAEEYGKGDENRSFEDACHQSYEWVLAGILEVNQRTRS